MEVIADNITAAVDYLNDNAAEGIDYQIDGSIVIEYNHNSEDKTVEWSWEESKVPISGKTVFRFYS